MLSAILTPRIWRKVLGRNKFPTQYILSWPNINGFHYAKSILHCIPQSHEKDNNTEHFTLLVQKKQHWKKHSQTFPWAKIIRFLCVHSCMIQQHTPPRTYSSNPNASIGAGFSASSSVLPRRERWMGTQEWDGRRWVWDGRAVLGYLSTKRVAHLTIEGPARVATIPRASRQKYLFFCLKSDQKHVHKDVLDNGNVRYFGLLFHL